MKRPLIAVKDLSLWYPKSGKTLPWLRKTKKNQDTLRALNNISLQLQKGECLGIIGTNGSGKSTLLKVIAGILSVQSGTVERHGTIFPMIQPNSICQPLLSGRENIHYLAAWTGHHPANWQDFENEIISFSELSESIDKIWAHYSSGMRSRLLFSFALAVKPDVLLLDEVLAVGDAAFRAKCYNALSRQKEKAGIILVSHDASQVAYVCDRLIWLEKGVIRSEGLPEDILNKYLSESYQDLENPESLHRVSSPVREVDLEFDHLENTIDSSLRLNLSLQLEAPLEQTWLRVLIYHSAGGLIAEADLKQTEGLLDWNAGKVCKEINIPSIPLQPGIYRLGLQLTHANGLKHYVWLLGLPLKVNGKHKGHGHWRLSGIFSKDKTETSNSGILTDVL